MASIPLEQLIPNFIFQLPNLATERWLSHAELLRCPRKIQRATNRHKVSQVPQFHEATIPKEHDCANREVLAELQFTPEDRAHVLA